jgi:glucoamylase
MPLVWAHAEYLKLWRSLRDGRVFDLPPQPVQRYLQEHTGSSYAVWRFNHRIRAIAAGNTLRIETLAPATVHWSSDEWTTAQDAGTRDLRLGIHIVDLPTESLPVGATIVFTHFWPDVDHWEGTDFSVEVVAARAASRTGS